MAVAVEQIEPGKIFAGGKHGQRRAVVQWGADHRWVCWAPEHERLPYGGFSRTYCTSTKSFAAWATAEYVRPGD